MNIVINKAVETVKNQAGQKPLNMRYGSWAVVTDVNSSRHTVTVKLPSGLEIQDVPVACTDEWVCEYEDYVSGARNLPPEGARVFLLMPTATYEGAFVLCSGLSVHEKKHKEAFMASKEERNKKNTIRKKITCGKWKSTYNYQTGAYDLISPNEGIKATLNDDNDKKEALIEVFGTTIKVNKDGGITIQGKKDAVVSFDGDVTVQGKKNATISFKGDVKANIEGNAQIESKKKVKIKAGTGSTISLNGSTYSGMVKADELILQLQKNTLILQSLLTALKTPIPEPGNGAPSAFQLFLLGAIGSFPVGNFANIKNNTVVHGG